MAAERRTANRHTKDTVTTETLFLTPNQTTGPLLAVLLQAAFLITEQLHQRNRAAAKPQASPPSRLDDHTQHRAKSRQILYWLRRLGLIVAFLSIGHLSAPSPGAAVGAAVVLFTLGMVVRWVSIAELGRFFTRDLMIQQGHQLLTHGIYRFIRHPSYSGMLLCNLGVASATRNWISMLLIAGTTVLLLLQRIAREERLLVDGFGAQYEQYRAHTAALIPWIY